MDMRMMRELARQISGIDTITDSTSAGRRPGTAEAGRSSEEHSQSEPASTC